MSSIRHHVYAIKQILSNGPSSSKFSFSDSFISFLLKNSRITLLKEKMNKDKSVSESNFSVLCVEMEKGNFSECNCEVAEGCELFKSISTIPELISTEGNYLNVLNINGEYLDRLSIDQNNYANYGLAKKTEGWFIQENKIYVLNAKRLEKVLVKAVFADLETISKLKLCDNTNEPICKNLDNEFFIDAELIEKLYKKVLELLGYSKNYKQDNTTLSTDDTLNIK